MDSKPWNFIACTPDITLMDLRMPNLNGVEAIAQIREASPTAQVVVLTTYANDKRSKVRKSLIHTLDLKRLRSNSAIYLQQFVKQCHS